MPRLCSQMHMGTHIMEGGTTYISASCTASVLLHQVLRLGQGNLRETWYLQLEYLNGILIQLLYIFGDFFIQGFKILKPL